MEIPVQRHEHQCRDNGRERNCERKHKRVPVRGERLCGKSEKGYGGDECRENGKPDGPVRSCAATGDKTIRSFCALAEVERTAKDRYTGQIGYENEEIYGIHSSTPSSTSRSRTMARSEALNGSRGAASVPEHIPISESAHFTPLTKLEL